ncbi:MAG: hypothetical protein V4563_17590 [Pseudomonadota bacterium]
MKIKPCGYFVLVKVDEVEETTKGGIVLPGALTEKEQAVVETGTIIDFGPTCYVGWKGCERTDVPAYQQWGVERGHKVEFKKFEGKPSALPDHENYRYIPDTHIIGVIL